jgi:hypothetical protein
MEGNIKKDNLLKKQGSTVWSLNLCDSGQAPLADTCENGLRITKGVEFVE